MPCESIQGEISNCVELCAQKVGNLGWNRILFKLNGKLDNRFLRNLLQYLLFSSENKAIIIIPIEI